MTIYHHILLDCVLPFVKIICYNMDAEILRAILKSYSNAENIQSENYENVSKETLLCIQSDTILNTLCTSLSNLLCYKISKEAYQRYSVRLLIIYDYVTGCLTELVQYGEQF
ncbi:uncharacterized protein LOC105835493 isoform X9 [Monomorium pharaonis]|uniref:uncharacterized protein LOC105835493 isoform X9 n=1 Tax=Monomorium pharaonis TaxID=307658 RepID=UPI00063F53C5|nr:uncharacterized protein LOC105835493 isoform X9 [Monomorium pharaonis]